MNEKVDNWLDSFEKFHKKYIIMPSESLNSPLLEERLFITFRSPPGFINQENKTIYDLNATFQMLYFNVLFRQLILNIDCYTMMIGLDKFVRWMQVNLRGYYIIRCQNNPSVIIDLI